MLICNTYTFKYLHDPRMDKYFGEIFPFNVQGHFKVKWQDFYEIHVYWPPINI